MDKIIEQALQHEASRIWRQHLYWCLHLYNGKTPDCSCMGAVDKINSHLVLHGGKAVEEPKTMGR